MTTQILQIIIPKVALKLIQNVSLHSLLSSKTFFYSVTQQWSRANLEAFLARIMYYDFSFSNKVQFLNTKKTPSIPVARLNTFLRSHNELLKIKAKNIPEALENLEVVFFRKNYYT